ncbi:thioredoxin family protein [Sediminibacterium ginsengisoli]|uniref:Peroxiredoxin n=1 Tax=Sediminibacterium ginsengisoli TaxID=413434 RepID=A0A1T4R9X5_9BACT|nr:thioredoxin family protein [Sediminibacterium ginsengisoli]SKA12880.1 Peroxiredoxin [Sediminibacterium ginsengisoli]
MKKMYALLTAAVLFFAATSQAQIASLALGSNLPLADLRMKDISGREVSVKEAGKKNGVLVMFSCNTCPYVIKNQQRTKEVADFAKQNDIGVILVNSNEGSRADQDSYAAMQAYAKEQGYDFYYAVDEGSRLANAYGATRTPELFIFDANGVLQYKGAIDDNPSEASNVKRTHAKEAIREMTEGKSVSIRESRSVGCTIKRVR